MAATTAEPTNTAAEEHPPPSLVDSIRTIVPKHAHIVAPWQCSDRIRPGKDSFIATWTTPAGSWSIRHPGHPDAPALLAEAIAGRSNRKPVMIAIVGPGVTWSFPADGSVSVSLISDYLTLLGAVEPVIPPAPKGFAYIGAVNSDGLSFLGGEPVSFTTTGQVSRPAAETMYGGPLPEAPAACDKDREELELTKREFGLLADDARRNVIEQEHRHLAAGVDLEEAHRHARTRNRALGLLERFYDASVVANIVNGANGQRLVPYADAAHIAADMIEKAIR